MLIGYLLVFDIQVKLNVECGFELVKAINSIPCEED